MCLGFVSRKCAGSCDLGAQLIIKLRVWQRPSENLREPRHNIPRSIAKFMYCAVYELAAVYCLRGGLRCSLRGCGEGTARYMHCVPQHIYCVPAYLYVREYILRACVCNIKRRHLHRSTTPTHALYVMCVL